MIRTIAAATVARERRAEVRLDLPLDRAKPGQYLLTIGVKRGTKETARRDVTFAVR